MNKAERGLKTIVDSKISRRIAAGLTIALVLTSCNDKDNLDKFLNTQDPSTPTSALFPVATSTPKPTEIVRPPTFTPTAIKATPIPTPTLRVELTRRPTSTPEPFRKPGTDVKPGDKYPAKPGDYAVGDARVNGQKMYDDRSETGLIVDLNGGETVEFPEGKGGFVRHTTTNDNRERFIREDADEMKRNNPAITEVGVLRFGKDRPQPSTTAESGSTPQSTITLKSGMKYTAQAGDVVSGDIVVNGKRMYDKKSGAEKTGLITIFKGGEIVEAPFEASLQHTNNSTEEINKVVDRKVADTKTGKSSDFTVDVVRYGEYNPQHPPLEEGKDFVLIRLKGSAGQPESTAISVKNDLLDRYDGVAVVFEGDIIGPDGQLKSGGNGIANIIAFDRSTPHYSNVIPWSESGVNAYIVKSAENVQELIDERVETKKEQGFSKVQVISIKYTDEGIKQESHEQK